MIFRDDDISCFTNLDDFKRVHDLFNKYETLHTIALIAKDIERHPSLIDYIKSQSNIDVQLHCWDHIDLTECHIITVKASLEHGIQKMEEIFNKIPTILYPPWNRSDERLEEACKEQKLEVSHKKISLPQYIKFNGDVSESTINFHYWAAQEVMYLEAALIIYNQRKHRCI